jgi:anti-sigma28 factor (negative regulator of flagellin synthesis)
MSEVNPIAGSSGAPFSSPIQRASIDPAAMATGTTQAQGAPRAQMHDRVELSEHARHLDRLRNLPDVRQAKIDAARNAIADGVFETPDRLRAALLRMLEEVEPG